jgi:asparagine synthase (glutamine-hydrolysing)
VAELLESLPPGFPELSPLAQDQYLENRTLLSGYLLSVQGDRMLMSHSVEGRFPFLDPDVTALAHSLPDSFKLRGLDEKHVLKWLGRDWVPAEILERKKQPYRAPDAAAFVGVPLPEWVEEALSPDGLHQAGVFQPAAVRGLWAKLQDRGRDGQFSNSDNMALIGVLSTQLLHRQFILQGPPVAGPLSFKVVEDRRVAKG